MQLLTTLFGSGNSVITAVFALAIVIILIFLALWALRLVTQASNRMVRGGRKRLAVIETLAVDGKRHLVIIRRDNTEHLILTGGPQDVVVETGFALEVAPQLPRPIPTVRRAAPPQQQAPAQPAAPPQAAAPQYSPPPAPAYSAPAPQYPAAPPAPQQQRLPMPVDEEAPTPPQALRGPLERLRDMGRIDNSRRPGSLRHTGLMRPISRMEPAFVAANADNSIPGGADSATSGRIMPFAPPRDGNAQDSDDAHPAGHRDESY